VITYTRSEISEQNTGGMEAMEIDVGGLTHLSSANMVVSMVEMLVVTFGHGTASDVIA